ncbi:uncharacterized protein [Amphiura filiformis]|uniref:uncharacterized protein n=1 Tax=Amphiura filiformis TaxID=82378 RepID=UPI003B21C959
MAEDIWFTPKSAESVKEWRQLHGRLATYNHSEAKLVTHKCRMKTREKHKSFKTSLLQCAQTRHPQLSPQCETYGTRNGCKKRNLISPSDESQSKKRLKSTLQLFVHVDSPEHAIWTVTLEKTSSIKSLKRKISNKYGIREQFELTGEDKYQLFELLTIEDHGIQDESNIYIKFAGGLRGGADKNPEEDQKQQGDKKIQENVSRLVTQTHPHTMEFTGISLIILYHIRSSMFIFLLSL